MRFRESAEPMEQSRLRERIWLIVALALRRYLGVHRARRPWIPSEDLEDVSSQKSLELVERIVSRSWEFTDRHGPEIAAYISATARNALADRSRGIARHVDLEPTELERAMNEASEWKSGPMEPEDPVAASEFARDLIRCLGALKARSRLMWFYRVFYDLSSRDIAAHPRIGLDVGHVDVLMQRTRTLIQQCLQKSGHDASTIPAGVYARIWDASRSWDCDLDEESK